MPTKVTAKMPTNTIMNQAKSEATPKETSTATSDITSAISSAITTKPTYKIPESVLVVIYTPKLEVLLLERADKSGFWQSVTGSKDALNEALSVTAQREVLEETGIDAQRYDLKNWQLSNVYEIYPVWRHRYAPGIVQNTEHVFGLCVPNTLAVTLSDREHLQYQWLPYIDAAESCFSASNAEAILQLPHRISV